MKWQQTSRKPPWPWWAVLIVLGWLGAVGAGVYLQKFHGWAPVQCWFKRVFQTPCPTCGMTRSVLHTLQGDPIGGFLYNPLWSVLTAIFIVLTLIRIFWGRRIRLDLRRSERIALWLLLAAVFLINWAYLIMAGI